MTPSMFRAGLACSIGLSLLAGCAAPTTAPAPMGAAPVETAGAPAAQETAPAPVLPAPVVATPTRLAGSASFRGEPLAGYALSVLDARTGEPVTLRDDLAGSMGLAVLNRGLTTDAQGAFALDVVGLNEGQALLVVATKGAVRVEAVVTSAMQSLGAKGYAVAQAGSPLALTELTTAIARVARGVLMATSALKPEAAAPVLARLATRMAELSAQLGTELARNPSIANELLASKDAANGGIRALVANAGQLRALTRDMAAMLGEVARGAQGVELDEQTRARLAQIELVGTVLGFSFADGGFTLTNRINGQRIDATAADLGTVTSQVQSSGSGSSSAPQSLSVEVATKQELLDALANANVGTITFTADIDMAAAGPLTYSVASVPEPTFLEIRRAVTIDGGNFRLIGGPVYAGQGHAVHAQGVTLKRIKFEAPLMVYHPTPIQGCEFKLASTSTTTAWNHLELSFLLTDEAVQAVTGNTIVSRTGQNSYGYDVPIWTRIDSMVKPAPTLISDQWRIHAQALLAANTITSGTNGHFSGRVRASNGEYHNGDR